MGGLKQRARFKILFLFLFAFSFLAFPQYRSFAAEDKCQKNIKALSDKNEAEDVDDKAVLSTLLKYVHENLNFPTIEQLADETSIKAPAILKSIGKPTEWLASIETFRPEAYERLKKLFANEYARLSKEVGLSPSEEDFLAQLNATEQKDFLFGKKGLFKSFDELDAYSKEINSKSFRYVIDRVFLDPERQEALQKAVKERKRLILTTAVAGAPVNQGMLNALLNFAKLKDAEILVFPANMQTTGLDPVLRSTPRVHVITHSLDLTKTMAVNNIKLIAKQILPLRGLEFIGPRGQSLIVGSPKMHVKTIPTVNNAERPHLQFTTGAITDPFYAGKKYISGRTDEKAKHDHVMGALILEWDDAIEDYRARHVEYTEGEGILDLDKVYTSDEVKPAQSEALVLGDVHSGETDTALFKTLPAVVKKLNPKRIVLHDLFNGHSINRHEASRFMTLAQRAERGELNLQKELELSKQTILALRAMSPDAEIVIVPSNHDLWIMKWLEDGRFVTDPVNARLGAILFAQASTTSSSSIGNTNKFGQAVYPFEYALRELLGLKDEKVRFLKVGERYSIGPQDDPVELSLHGHAGAGGAKGSIGAIAKGTDRAVFGHSHTYARLNGVVNVGTITVLDPAYMRDGLSGWVQSIASVGKNGEIQVYIFKGGSWWSNGNAKEKETPLKVIPNAESDGAGQVDQHSGD